MKYTPVIVVVAFNRPNSLRRILSSLKRTHKVTNVKLVISIDNNEPQNYDVKDIANDFEWPFGDKEVIYQPKRLGLRNHILQCGDLTATYGSVIILEDDLFVSPYFYEYAVRALEYYDNDDSIGGISLYAQPREDISELPFTAIHDGSDVFFIQFPSSWGQAWSVTQWKKFRDWYNKEPDIKDIPMSSIIHKWPGSSWKKYFVAYMVENNKYFVYPRLSLTTNFNDPGTNYRCLENNDGQTPLRLTDSDYQFKSLKESFCVYDAYFELMPDKISLLSPELKDYAVELDLYGNKEISAIRTPYVVTSKMARNILWSYRRALKPHDLNIILGLKGTDLFFCLKQDLIERVNNTGIRDFHNYKYFYCRHLPGKMVYLYKVLSRFKIISSHIYKEPC